MADLMQQARELLAAEYERDGITYVPDCIRSEAMLTEMEQRAIRAIAAALRAAPEVPERLHIPLRPNGARPNHDYVRGWNACIEAMQAARPQGVSHG